MTRPTIQSVSIVPNPVNKGQTFRIAVVAIEEELVRVVNPQFKFAFAGTSAGNLNMGEITYAPANS